MSAFQSNCVKLSLVLLKKFSLGGFNFLAENLPAGGKINDCVPDSLKRKNTTTGNAQAKADPVIMSKAVEPVDGAGNPCNEYGETKDEAGAQVCHLHGIQSLELQRGI